jgi:phosphatidate cytidylyltransferase
MYISTNFKQRLLASAIGILILSVLIYMSPQGIFTFLFTIAFAGILSVALWEFYQLATSGGYKPQITIGIISTIAYVLALYLNHLMPLHNALPEAVLGLTVIAAFLQFFFTGHKPLVNLSITLFGILYLIIPLGCLYNINFFFSPTDSQDGRLWLLYVIAVTKMTDTGAYFWGKLYGKTPMAPYISPKKTLEGALVGFISGVLTSFIFYSIAHTLYSKSPIALTFFQSIALGGCISILAQFGDLAESLLKRDMGAKDSNQLPGLGGMLDILDSLVFTAPLMYLFLKISNV